MAANQPRQPNFPLLARNLHGAADELGLCENIPAATDGALVRQLIQQGEQTQQLFTQMTQMHQQMGEFREQMVGFREQMTQFQQQLGRMEERTEHRFSRQEGMTFNLSGRLTNSDITRTADYQLVVFKSLLTFELIPNFPETAAEIEDLDRDTLVEILAELEVQPRGNTGQVRAQFKHLIGLPKVSIIRA